MDVYSYRLKIKYAPAEVARMHAGWDATPFFDSFREIGIPVQCTTSSSARSRRIYSVVLVA